MNIDQELDGFDDNSYDAVILSRTVQAIHQPATVLTHMKRIAPTVIVSMPNFAYWRNRFRLMAGRAPVSKDLPYAWHDSPNVHFGSCRDLEGLFEELGLTVMQCIALSSSGKKSRFPTKLRNLTAGAALYRLTTTNPR
jgi:methionine biosynthesis protein MetW